MECFICLETKNTFIKVKCCKKFVHQSCQKKWIQYNKNKKILNCPCCRKKIKNDIFVPLELHNLPYTFYEYDSTEYDSAEYNSTEYRNKTVTSYDNDTDSEDENI